jgi:hypothetical protein
MTGSGDGVADDVVVVSCTSDLAARHRDAGARVARGEIVAFLNAAAVPYPNWVESLASAYEDGTVSGAGGFVVGPCGSDVQRRSLVVRRDGSGASEVAPPLDPFLAAGADPHLVLPATNCSFRRSALAEFGGWTTRPDNCWEVEICRRLIDAGHRLAVLPNALVQLRETGLTVRGWRDDESTDDWTTRFVAHATDALERWVCERGRPLPVRATAATAPTVRDQCQTEHTSRRPWRRRGANPSAVIVDSSVDGRPLELDASHGGEHVLWTTSGDQTVVPVIDAANGLVWQHAVAIEDRVLSLISDKRTRMRLINEAALLHELRRVRSWSPSIRVVDERRVAGWPFVDLIHRTADELVVDVCDLLLADASIAPAVDIPLVARTLLDTSAFPRPLRDRMARALTLPPHGFLSELTRQLLDREPSPAEESSYLPMLQTREGRTRLLGNVASSSEAAFRFGSPSWLDEVDELEREGSVARLFDAVELPADRCLDELYRAILGRDPDRVGRATFTKLLRTGAHPTQVAASMLISQEASTRWPDSAAMLAALGWSPQSG